MTKENVITHNTAVIGDLHLSDAEPHDPKRTYWKNFKKERHFIDGSFAKFIEHIQKKSAPLPAELILNGDIFDYDSVMTLPTGQLRQELSSLEKKIGVDCQEDKSLFKTEVILDQHHVFIKALKSFVQNGNKVVFIIGNHDIELYWPSVQKEIVLRLAEGLEEEKRIVFCEWFYISQKDTLIEHGHQYDPYCLCLDPINPLIFKKKEHKVRLPFGNIANRFILNSFGLKNPHHDESFVKSGMEFLVFFLKYELKVQPFLVFHWLFGSLRALKRSLGDGFTPASRDPLTHQEKIKSIAEKSNSEPAGVLALNELRAHPAVHKPFQIIRELWLDRFFLMVILIGISWQIFTTYSLFDEVSLWWFAVPLFISIPILAYYAQGIKSEVHHNSNAGQGKVPVAAQIANVNRVVHGHTHQELVKNIEGVEFLNPGSWSPYFDDIECEVNKSSKKYIWIESNGSERVASLNVWEKA